MNQWPHTRLTLLLTVKHCNLSGKNPKLCFFFKVFTTQEQGFLDSCLGCPKYIRNTYTVQIMTIKQWQKLTSFVSKTRDNSGLLQPCKTIHRPGVELLVASRCNLLLANCNVASKVLERFGESLERLGDDWDAGFPLAPDDYTEEWQHQHQHDAAVTHRHQQWFRSWDPEPGDHGRLCQSQILGLAVPQSQDYKKIVKIVYCTFSSVNEIFPTHKSPCYALSVALQHSVSPAHCMYILLWAYCNLCMEQV